MKLLLTSDWHLRPNRPEYLENDILELQEKKIEWVKSLDFDMIVNAGDVFESPYADQTFINWCLEHVPNMIAIPGNHDLPLRHPFVGITRSIYLSMVLAGKFLNIEDRLQEFEDVIFTTVPFDSEIDVKPDKAELNILVLHTPVFLKKVPWWSKSGMTVKELAKITKGFDVVLTGDIHQSFMVKTKSGRIFINPGGLFYESVKDKQKFVYILDTKTRLVSKYEIPRFEKFTEQAQKEISVDSKTLNLFVKYVEDGKVETIDFVSELKSASKVFSKGVQNKIMEAIDEINREN